EIGRDRQLGRLDDGARVRERLGARHAPVAPAEHARRGAARGGERLEAQAGEDARRARVPRVGDDERARALMQLAEAIGLLGSGARRSAASSSGVPGSVSRCLRKSPPAAGAAPRSRSESPTSAPNVFALTYSRSSPLGVTAIM